MAYEITEKTKDPMTGITTVNFGNTSTLDPTTGKSSPIIQTSDKARDKIGVIQQTITDTTLTQQQQAEAKKQKAISDAHAQLTQLQQQVQSAKDLGYGTNDTLYYDDKGNLIENPKVPETGTSSIVNKYLGEDTSTDTTVKPEKTVLEIENDRLIQERDEYHASMDQAQNGTLPLTVDQQAQIDELNKAYDRAIDMQLTANKNYEMSMTQAGISAGRQRYAPEMEAGNIKTAVDKGISKITELNGKKAGALAEMREGFKTNNINLINNSYKNFLDAEKQITDNINKMADDVRIQEDAAKKLKEQSDKDIAIADYLSQGITNPADILKNLSKKGYVATAKEVSDTIGNLAVESGLSVDDFTGETKNFMALKNAGQLPTSITALPEGQQLTSYLQMVRNIETSKAGGIGNGMGLVGGIYTPGDNPTVDSWAERIQNGTAKITDIPASQWAMRNAVTVALQSMGNSVEGKPTTTELGKAALEDAKGLMLNFNIGKGTSAVGKSAFLNSLGYGFIPGTNRANFVNDFNSIKDKLSLDSVKYLKGQGQVSDAERALLANAVTKLNLNQSESDFKKTLQSIIDKLQGNIQIEPIITGNSQDGVTLPGDESDNNFNGVTLPN